MIASLVGKLSNFTSKNRLITQVSNRELVLQHGGFATFPGSQPHRESSSMPSGSGYNEPMSEAEVSNFPWLEST
jgi:hypothetical protein